MKKIYGFGMNLFHPNIEMLHVKQMCTDDNVQRSFDYNQQQNVYII